jgi:hypothetical protein
MANDLLPRLAAIYAGRFSDGTTAPPIQPGGARGEVPLSFFQERIWEAIRRQPGTSAFASGFSFRLPAGTDPQLIERCLQEIVQRHDALRMFISRERPVARVLDNVPLAVARVDLRSSPAPFDEVRSRLTKETFRPFDLEQAPLLRATLFQLGDDDHLLLLAYHEIILNRTAIAILLSEMGKLYSALRDGEPSPLAEPAIQFSDFMRWQREWLRGDELERRLARWRRRFDGCVPLQLRTDSPRTESHAHRDVAHEKVTIPNSLLEACTQLGQAEFATAFMVQTAALLARLHDETGIARIVLPVMASIRRRETNGLVATLSTVIHLCVDLDGDPSFRTLIERTKEASLQANEDQYLPTWWALPAPAEGLLVDYFANIALPLTLSGSDAHKENFPIGAEKALLNDMEWRTYTYEGETACVAPYDAALFRADSVGRRLRGYVRVLEEAVAHPDLPLSRLCQLGS